MSTITASTRTDRAVDPWRGRASGPAPYRIAYLGSEQATGEGVATHDLGLLGQLARRLHGLTGHGVDVDGAPLDETGIDAVAASLRRQRFPAVDAVVVELGEEVVTGDWDLGRGVLDVALRELCRTMPAHSLVVVLALQSLPEAGQQALELIVGTLPRAAHLVTASGGDGEPDRERYVRWSAMLAETIATGLHSPFHWADPADEVDGVRRRQVLQRMSVDWPRFTDSLQRLVTIAAAAYDASYAAVSVIDGTHTRYVTTFGSIPPGTVPRPQSICSTVVDRYGGLILGDSATDPRFVEVGTVVDGTVRFYAGYRIQDPTGTPIGVVCVYDDAPREVVSQDIDVLRDIAAVIEHRLWESMTSRAESSPP